MFAHGLVGRRPFGAFLILLSVLLLATSGLVYTAQSAQAGVDYISDGKHEGQLQGTPGDPSTVGAYTTGNVTTYQEGDRVNLRIQLNSDADGLVGNLEVHYSREVPGSCTFFLSTLTLGTHNGEAGIFVPYDPPGGATPGEQPASAVLVGAPYVEGAEWVQEIQVTWGSGGHADNGGHAYLYYYLEIAGGVGGCTGSSQHSRLEAADPAGSYFNSGNSNVPIPANAIVRIPDITITKMIDRDGDGTFESNAGAGEYSFTLDGTTTLLTNSSGQVTFANVEPAGLHTVTEAQADFSLGTYHFVSGSGTSGCVFSGSTANVTVVAPSTSDVPNPSCTFYNGPEPGSITIIKDAVGASAGTAVFDFTTTGLTPSSFTLGDLGSRTFSSLLPGTYVVTETGETGWDLTNVSCVGATGSTVGIVGNVVTIGLAVSEDITCTFTNTERGHIIVDKVTDPSGSAQSFEFDPSWGDNFFLADGDPTHDSGALIPGTYSVAEVTPLPAGWSPTSATCSDGSAPSAIDLAAGETVTCTFSNMLARGRIIVDKVTDPSGSAQSFEFDPSWGDNFFLADGDPTHDSGALLPGSYSVAEVNLPTGWSLTGATCSDGSAPGAISLAAGEVVTCTFTDTLARGHIVVDKVTDPSGSAQSFEFDPSWGDNFFLADGDPTHDSGALLPGSYSVAEVNLPTGWSLTSATCSDGSAPGAIDLGPGETVTCTFTDTLARGHIIVDKVTDPERSSQSFEFDPSWGVNFSLTDTATPADSGALLPGTHSVAEVNLPTGWSLTSATCDDGSDPAAIDLGPGETVTCTFANYLARGHIVVDKVTDPTGSAQSFEFDPSWGVNFSLTDAATPADSGALLPGTYSVAEVNLPAGWSLSSATCDDGSAPGAIDLGPGETVTCTFSNYLARGNIIVDKVTDPSGDPTQFEFDPSWGDNFLLTDTGTPADSGALLPGTYSVAEVNLPAGWSLSNVTCSDQSDPAAIDLGPGETVTCTFSNYLGRGNIIVDKVTDPAGSAQQFQFDPSWGDDFVLADGDAPHDSGALLPGSYSVAEINLPSGWSLSNATCDDGSAPGAINLAPGEVVTCTFTNYLARGHIVVDKVTDPAGSAQSFEFDPSWGDNFSLTDAGTPADSGELLPGSYSVAEVNLPAGWSLTSATCSDGSAPGAINLGPGETVTCTFTDTLARGHIVVDKVTDPAGSAQSFEFDPSWGDNFSLTDAATPADSGELLPGSYSVAEVNVPAGWTLTGATCSDGSAPGAIDLGPGETVTCTFTNTQYGHIIVDKVTDPAGSAQTFEFDPSWGDNFSLTDAATPADSGELLPGTYSVAEVNLPSGWSLSNVVCSDQSDPAAIDLSAGETVTCTFTNFLGRGNIIVDKVTDPAAEAAEFEFDPSWGDNFFLADEDTPHNSGALLPGTHSVAEINLPSGWSLSSATCSDGSAPGAIDLGPGETVTCTFTNYLARGHIVVDKVTDPAGSAQTFEFDPSWGDNFSLTDAATPADSGELLPGTYSVAEVNLPAGWSLSSATCSDGSAPGAIELDPGETVTCTFTNYLGRGNIIVDKVTDPAGSAQSFEFDPSWGDNFFLTDGGAPVDSGSLLPGTYSVAEVNLPAGWSLSSATCSDGSAPGAIDLGPGEVVTCTFTNYLARGHIVVDKVTDPSGVTQSFEFDPSWGDNFFLADAGTPVDSGELLPGGYSVAEVNLPAGWALTGAICDDGSDPAAIDLGPGETVTCTFTNYLARGHIVVDKVTDPAGDATEFEFDPSWGDNFFLADAGTPADSGELLPGSYSVAEVNLPAGWALTGAICDDGSDPAAIDLGPGETVTCTFTNFNPPEGSITIIKDATPLNAAGNDTPFGFSGDLGNFELKDPSDPSRTVIDLDPGQYTVTEDALTGDWKFDQVTCDAQSWSADGQSVTINLAQGEAAVCTFENFEEEVEPPTGSITIVKDATPLDASGDDTPFGFSGDLGVFELKDPSDPSKTVADLLAGEYTITEDALAGNWKFDQVTCDAQAWSADGQSVTINLAEGEVAVCTFENFEEENLEPTGVLTIIKDATPGDNTAFTFSAGALGSFTLKDPADTWETFSHLEAGTYVVTEGALPDGWTFKKVECTAGDWSVEGRTVTVNLADGEVATCTFFNEGELPFTGPNPLLLPTLLAGLGSLLMGLGLLLLARRREMA